MEIPLRNELVVEDVVDVVDVVVDDDDDDGDEKDEADTNARLELLRYETRMHVATINHEEIETFIIVGLKSPPKVEDEKRTGEQQL